MMHLESESSEKNEISSKVNKSFILLAIIANTNE